MIQKIPNIHSLVLYIFMATGLIFLSACDNRDYVADKTFDKVCWASGDALTFSLDLSSDTDLPLYLSFSPEYVYQNIYLKLSYTNPEGVSTDVLFNKKLSDKLGNWLTERKGGEFAFEHPNAFHIEAKSGGTYQFSLVQYMREDNLCGIEKIGIIRP